MRVIIVIVFDDGNSEFGPFDDGPVKMRAVLSTNRFGPAETHNMEWHFHDRGQFIFIESGLSTLQTEAGNWIIPIRRVAWLPPRVRHASHSNGPVKGWVVLTPSRIAKRLPKHVCVLRASNLMVAALERVTLLSGRERGLEALLWEVLLKEMRQSHLEEFELPLPRSPRIRRIAEAELKCPNVKDSLKLLASHAGVSKRSFTRHFLAETGMSFSEWKRTALALHAIKRIAAGNSVSSAAFDIGYESVSAFVAMFRRKYGTSPMKFLMQHPDVAGEVTFDQLR